MSGKTLSFQKNLTEKDLEKIILGSDLLQSAIKVLKICEPIVDMPCMVDRDTPSMGFVYEGMDRCKEAIAKSLTMWKVSTWTYGR